MDGLCLCHVTVFQLTCTDFFLTDAMSVIGFLKHFGLDKDFKLNIEPNHTTLAGHSYEHDIIMASVYVALDYSKPFFKTL